MAAEPQKIYDTTAKNLCANAQVKIQSVRDKSANAAKVSAEYNLPGIRIEKTARKLFRSSALIHAVSDF